MTYILVNLTVALPYKFMICPRNSEFILSNPESRKAVCLRSSMANICRIFQVPSYSTNIPHGLCPAHQFDSFVIQGTIKKNLVGGIVIFSIWLIFEYFITFSAKNLKISKDRFCSHKYSLRMPTYAPSEGHGCQVLHCFWIKSQALKAPSAPRGLK